jgi:hypothetical protein
MAGIAQRPPDMDAVAWGAVVLLAVLLLGALGWLLYVRFSSVDPEKLRSFARQRLDYSVFEVLGADWAEEDPDKEQGPARPRHDYSGQKAPR